MGKYHKLTSMLEEELDKISASGKLGTSSLEVGDKVAHFLKSVKTIEAMDEATEGESYAYEYPMDDGRLDLTPSLKEEGETLASILDPLTRNEVGKIIAPRKGYLMSISGSYWSAGTVGDYQPRLPDSIMEMYHD
jgi:hypothetical protein